MNRIGLAFAALYGWSGVLCGASGAHGLKAFLAERGMTGAWDTAVLYQLVHAVVLLWAAREGMTWRWVIWAMCAGVFLFSGSLYAMALTGFRALGMVTPLGGVILLLGWTLILAQALKR